MLRQVPASEGAKKLLPPAAFPGAVAALDVAFEILCSMGEEGGVGEQTQSNPVARSITAIMFCGVSHIRLHQ